MGTSGTDEVIQRVSFKYEAHQTRKAATVLLVMSDVKVLLELIERLQDGQA